MNSARNRCLINPSSDTIVEEGDQLIMMRPTCIASYAYKPLKKPVTVDRGKLTAAQTTVIAFMKPSVLSNLLPTLLLLLVDCLCINKVVSCYCISDSCALSCCAVFALRPAMQLFVA